MRTTDVRYQVLEVAGNADADVTTLWRCTKCDKWSHAMKKPANHKRGVVKNEGSDFHAAEYELVPCGPFVRWTAVKG